MLRKIIFDRAMQDVWLFNDDYPKDKIMEHKRAIPRDFFNESKLLKCMGLLSLAIKACTVPNNIKIEININDNYEEGQPFKISLDGKYELLYVDNYDIEINGEIYTFGTRYNSEANFPFFVFCGNEEIEVFDDNGKFSNEFISKFKKE